MLSHVQIFCDPMPTRLLCPWDFPGKNTGMGCHWSGFLRASSWCRDQTWVSCIGMCILYQWTTRKAPCVCVCVSHTHICYIYFCHHKICAWIYTWSSIWRIHFSMFQMNFLFICFWNNSSLPLPASQNCCAIGYYLETVLNCQHCIVAFRCNNYLWIWTYIERVLYSLKFYRF